MFRNFWFYLVAIFLFFVGLINPAMAENFYIDNYDVNIIVDKNKSADITENIDVVFTNPSHGIFRNIPFQNASVTNINVSEHYAKTYSPSNVNLKIGDANRLINGEYHYTIHYKYNYKDNKNEFYHNIIGTDWAVDINKAAFNVTLPETVEPEKVGVSIGKYGTKGFDGDGVYSVSDNKISGYTKRKLNPYEGITIRVEVPEGYFNKTINIQLPYGKILGILGVLILTILAYVNWNKFGKEEHTTPIITFYPPKNLNSAEVGAVFAEEVASLKDDTSLKYVVSLILYLASKGYIKIETEKSGLFSNDFTIKKIKSYNGEKEEEKLLMKALFKNSDKVTKEELTKSRYFYKDCAKILELLEQKSEKYFEKISFSKYLKMYGFWFGIFIFSIISFINFSSFELQSINQLLGYFLFIFLFSFFFLILLFLPIGKILKYCLSSALFAMFVIIPCFSEIVEFPWNKWIFIFNIVCFVITSICFTNMSKRTAEGNNLYQEILGFKHFLQVSEKSRLEALINENVNYYNEILPYAYALGISSMIINKFKDLIPICPDWYEGDFDSNNFNRLASGLNFVACPTRINGGIQSSSSSGSFSSSSGGGGHSGGGGGGGGGGSW